VPANRLVEGGGRYARNAFSHRALCWRFQHRTRGAQLRCRHLMAWALSRLRASHISLSTLYCSAPSSSANALHRASVKRTRKTRAALITPGVLAGRQPCFLRDTSALPASGRMVHYRHLGVTFRACGGSRAAFFLWCASGGMGTALVTYLCGRYGGRRRGAARSSSAGQEAFFALE